MSQCVICKTSVAGIDTVEGSNIFVNCCKCDKYIIGGELYEILKRSEERLPHVISSWIQEQNTLYKEIPRIFENDLETLKTIPDKTIQSKLETFMQEVHKRDLMALEQGVSVEPQSDPSWLSITWSRNCDELKSIIEEAISIGLIVGTIHEYMGGNPCSWICSISNITFRGRNFIESLGMTTGASNKVFMAFHFTDEMKESFEKTVRKAVTDISSGKLEAIRVSTSGTSTDTKIDDELISMIKASRVVVADFTGQRTAVYYEAGYAMGLGIPVIWTCRADHIESLSFDTRQYPHILWEDAEDLYTQLSQRISAQIL